MPVPVDETPSANVVALVVTGQASHGCMDTAPALYTIRINGHLGATVLMAFPALASRRHGAHTVLTPQDAGVASATVTVGQQLGASVGTSLLNTIFTAAITSYLTAHLAAARLIGRQALTGLALAHGYDTAFWWIAGIFAVGAVVGGVLPDMSRTLSAARSSMPTSSR